MTRLLNILSREEVKRMKQRSLLAAQEPDADEQMQKPRDMYRRLQPAPGTTQQAGQPALGAAKPASVSAPGPGSSTP